MSLIHGSRGIIYFVHQFKPTFVEAALLQDPENLAAVTRINAQIKELAPVLNSPTIEREIKVVSELPVATMLKQVGGTNYLFTVGMENRAGEATFNFRELSGVSDVELIGESRSIAVSNREFRDRYKPYQVHLYKFCSAK